MHQLTCRKVTRYTSTYISASLVGTGSPQEYTGTVWSKLLSALPKLRLLLGSCGPHQLMTTSLQTVAKGSWTLANCRVQEKENPTDTCHDGQYVITLDAKLFLYVRQQTRTCTYHMYACTHTHGFCQHRSFFEVAHAPYCKYACTRHVYACTCHMFACTHISHVYMHTHQSCHMYACTHTSHICMHKHTSHICMHTHTLHVCMHTRTHRMYAHM